MMHADIPIQSCSQHWSYCTQDCTHLHYPVKTQTILVKHWFPRASVICIVGLALKPPGARQRLYLQAVFLIDKDSWSLSMLWMSTKVTSSEPDASEKNDFLVPYFLDACSLYILNMLYVHTFWMFSLGINAFYRKWMIWLTCKAKEGCKNLNSRHKR